MNKGEQGERGKRRSRRRWKGKTCQTHVPLSVNLSTPCVGYVVFLCVGAREHSLVYGYLSVSPFPCTEHVENTNPFFGSLLFSER